MTKKSTKEKDVINQILDQAGPAWHDSGRAVRNRWTSKEAHSKAA